MNTIEQWVAGDKIQGGRSYQEDRISIALLTGERAEGDRLLLLLADGMGGHAGGAVASETVLRAFQATFDQAAADAADADIAAILRAGVDAANRAVREKQHADPALSEMGSTLVAALIRADTLYWASVGDSPLWVLRDGHLTRLNQDHSMLPLLLDLVELGRLTEDEARNDPRVHQLRSAVSGADLALIDIAADGYPLQAGDLVLVASDGLETLPDEEIAALAARHDGADDIVRALLEGVVAVDAPGQDNASVLAYRVGDERHSLSATLAEMDAPTQGSAARPQSRDVPVETPSARPAAPDEEDEEEKPARKSAGVFAKVINRVNSVFGGGR